MVDDDSLILEIAQLSLERAGWDVVTAANGSDAVQVAVTERPDAVLMDVMMPVMDGPTACRRLAELPETAGIPVILFTAKALRSERREWEDLPVAGVIPKPFDPLRLPEEISALLGW